MTLDEIEKTLVDLRARVMKLEGQAKNGAQPKAQAEVADDADLDGKYGNPNVRKDPPIWIKEGGESYLGRLFSECPAEYLDSLAKFFDWKVKKDLEKGTDEGNKYAEYGKRDAARARGWAQRIRTGTPSASASNGDLDMPF